MPCDPAVPDITLSLAARLYRPSRSPIIGRSMSELQTFLETCENAVRAAGATIRDWMGKTSVQQKGPADFVTEADFAAQEVVKTTVLQAFPQHSVLGEEDQLAGNTPSTDRVSAGSSIRWTARRTSCMASPIMRCRWPWSSTGDFGRGRLRPVAGRLFYRRAGPRGISQRPADPHQPRDSNSPKPLPEQGFRRNFSPTRPTCWYSTKPFSVARRCGARARHRSIYATWRRGVSACCGVSRPKSGTSPPASC